MGKDVKIALTVPNCSAASYHAIVYEDPETIRAYHQQLNAQGTVTVSPWADGARVVCYSIPIKVPAILKSAIGVDVMNVKEHQKVVWQGTACFTVQSSPSMDFPGSSKFRTDAITVVSQNGDNCLVEVQLKCSADMPWGLQGTVESMMEVEGREAISKFLTYTKQVLEARLQEQLAPPVASPHTPPQEQEEPSLRLAATGNVDEFYDAADGFTDASLVSSCLRDISHSLAQTARSLESLDKTLKHIDDHVAKHRHETSTLWYLLMGAAVGSGVTLAVMRWRGSYGGAT